jgi:hypothetical protein
MANMRRSVLLAFIAMALAVTFFATSCSSPADMPGPDAANPDTSVPMGCPSGYSQCGNDCAPLKRDPTNCGACGKACKEGEVCVQGGCALQCAGGATKCGAECASTKSDPNNCGMCGTKCATGQVCNLGKCALSCESTLTNCSGACVDLQTDDDNCGVCGTACDSGQKCAGGKCVANCQMGWSSCPNDGGTTCVDLTTDNSNCGTCGNQCPNGQFCSPGSDGGQSSCGLACFGGTTKCGNKCVDLKIDPQNCGACGVPCNGTCFNGMCCANNLVWCGACTNISTDKNNCGMCGVQCGGPCNNGVCCGVNEIICNGTCSNTQTDPKNCGMCGNVCGGNTPGCQNGMCVAYVDHGPMHTFTNLTTDHFITQGCCSVGCNGNDAVDADYFCKHFYGNNCSVLAGYKKHTTPNGTYGKMHKNGGCTTNGNDIPNTVCDQNQTNNCKIGNWNEITQGLNNLICRCL